MTCRRCGATLGSPGRVYCSRLCKDEAQRRPASFKCGACGRTVSTYQSQARKRKYCSHECYRKHFNGAFFSGSNNGNWRGGKALSYGPGWKTIKAEIRSRDVVCQGCGKTPEDNGRALDVHHLDPFRFSGNNSMDNLVALCRSCHMRADDHGRSGSAKFIRNAEPKRPTKREIRRLKQLLREAERRALRRHRQWAATEMSVQGASLREIARALGVSHETVSLWLKGYHRVLDSMGVYRANRAKRRQRPLGRPLLSCPPPRPGSSVGRARV